MFVYYLYSIKLWNIYIQCHFSQLNYLHKFDIWITLCLNLTFNLCGVHLFIVYFVNLSSVKLNENHLLQFHTFSQSINPHFFYTLFPPSFFQLLPISLLPLLAAFTLDLYTIEKCIPLIHVRCYYNGQQK